MAEHSFLVQLIAIELSRLLDYSTDRKGPFNTQREYHIMRWAMWHDMMEVKTGDINTPMKKLIKSIAGNGAIDEYEYSLSDEYAKISLETYDTEKDIVKLADLMEAVNFLAEEGKGDHADEVRHELRAAMMAHYKKARARYCTLKWDNVLTLLEKL